jgi:peptidoglycan/xylan/chitin deacetylase (PgdA/CDA1 family)
MGRLVHMVKTLVALVWVHGGFLRLVHRWRRPHVLVLAYHRVTPDAELAGCAYPAMHVSTRTFEAQLEALRELYRPIPMATLHDILSGRVPLREHVAVVTFDDGYRDNFHNAMPILTRLGVPATFFLSVDFVDRNRPFWFDALADGMRRWDADPVVRERGETVLPDVLRTALQASGSYAARLSRAAAALKTLPDEQREAAVRALSGITGDAATRGGTEPMNWDDVRTMREQGMHFAAHGVRHAILTRMPPVSAEEEIQRSLEVIGARTGTAVQEFAYPNGDTDDEVARRAAHAGVALAFTMRPASVRPGDDPHRIGRSNVCEDTSRGALGRFSKAYFWCEITGVFDRLLWRGRRGRA